MVTFAPIDDLERLKRLQRVSDAALSLLSVEDLLDELLLRVRDILGTDTAAVLLLDPERNELLARAAKGIEEEWSVASGSRSGSSTARVCTASLCSRSCSRAPTAIVPVRATGWEHLADA